MKSNINFSYLIFLSVVAALGGFLFGYDAAVISGTISQVTVKFGLDEIQIGWFVGCALIGSIIGVLFAGKLSDMWGRKVTMLIAAVFFSVSGIGCAFSDSLEQLVFARMLGGIGIGIHIGSFNSSVSGTVGCFVSISYYYRFFRCIFDKFTITPFVSEWTCAKC